MTKKELRNHVLNRRRNMSAQEVTIFSEAICSKVISNGFLENITDVCLYMPIQNEVELSTLISVCREKQIRIWLPRIIDKQMDFYLYDSDTKLISGAYNILEPDNTTKLIPSCKTTIFVPGSVFSNMGDRIGYGGGYYDRYMINHPACKYIAVCYDFQILPEIPCEEHDQKPNIILSEQRIIYTS